MDSTLKASLKSLQANLAAIAAVDEELQELLLQLDGDIQQLLGQRVLEQQADVGVGVSPNHGLAVRTQEISAKFAAQHPQLEPALRELGNILSSMGI